MRVSPQSLHLAHTNIQHLSPAGGVGLLSVPEKAAYISAHDSLHVRSQHLTPSFDNVASHLRFLKTWPLMRVCESEGCATAGLPVNK